MRVRVHKQSIICISCGLNFLHPLTASYSENTVRVRAYTSAGPGMPQEVTFLTGEDSESLSDTYNTTLV